jgi:hypothetical protein
MSQFSSLAPYYPPHVAKRTVLPDAAEHTALKLWIYW